MRKICISLLLFLLILFTVTSDIHSQKKLKPVTPGAPKIFGSEPYGRLNFQDIPTRVIILSDGSALVGISQTGHYGEAYSTQLQKMYDTKTYPRVPLFSNNPLSSWPFAMKINAQEQREWMQVIYPEQVPVYTNQGWMVGDLYMNYAAPTSDGFIIGGWAPMLKPEEFNDIPVLIRYKNNGKKVWEKLYTDFLIPGDKFSKAGILYVAATKNGISAIIYAGSMEPSSREKYLIKMDPQGNILPDTKKNSHSKDQFKWRSVSTRTAIFIRSISPTQRAGRSTCRNITVKRRNWSGRRRSMIRAPML